MLISIPRSGFHFSVSFSGKFLPFYRNLQNEKNGNFKTVADSITKKVMNSAFFTKTCQDKTDFDKRCPFQKNRGWVGGASIW